MELNEIMDEIKDIIQDAMREAANAGAEAALVYVETLKKKGAKEAYDRRLRNTKLLVQHYRLMKEHCKNHIADSVEAQEAYREADGWGYDGVDLAELMDARTEYDDKYIVESITKSAARTAIIMNHITQMLDIYGVYANRSTRPSEKMYYDILCKLYINDVPETAQDVASHYGIDTRTVYKHVDKACTTLAALLFGIDGIRKPGK